MSVRLSRTSRLAFHELLRDADGRDFFDLPEYPPLLPQADDLEHAVERTDRLDLLAQHYYGDAGFQWVLALANGIDLWPTGLCSGQTLRVPSPRYVRQVWYAQAQPRTR